MISNKQPNVPRQRARERKTQAKDGRKQRITNISAEINIRRKIKDPQTKLSF